MTDWSKLNYTVGKGKKKEIISNYLTPEQYVAMFEKAVKDWLPKLKLTKWPHWEKGLDPYKDEITAEAFHAFMCGVNFGRHEDEETKTAGKSDVEAQEELAKIAKSAQLLRLRMK